MNRIVVRSVVGALVTVGVLAAPAWAARLNVANTRVAQVNTQSKLATIEAQVTWENAWKNDVNCDGAWVFCKYRAADGTWRHVRMAAASAGEFDGMDRTPAGFPGAGAPDVGLWVPAERTGTFVFKTAKGKGNVACSPLRLLWNYAEAGLDDAAVMQSAVQAFGIEMVHIPQDKHYVGDPQGPTGPDNCLYKFPGGSAYLIANEDPIMVASNEGALFCEQDNPRSRDDVPFEIPAGFPKGYKAFWVMKYELTSRQYVQFLNTLTRKQQQSRVAADISGDTVTNYYVLTNTHDEELRNAVVCAKTGNGTTEPMTFFTPAPARAVNFMGWADIVAYADWAGLRPITELEYEKAARGPLDAVPDECAWGTSRAGRVDMFDGADGSGSEIKVPRAGLVNACFGGGIAPFDVGKKTVPDNPGFEGPVSGEVIENSINAGFPEREEGGLSYYGVRHLSGNVWERCVTIGHPLGRAYDARRGDGLLDGDGFADVENWPGRDGSGAGNRGGVWSSPAWKYLRIALRFAANFPKSTDGKNSGCRVGF